MVHSGVPEYLRSDNRPEFVAKNLRQGQWLINTGAKTLYIEHGSPWENGYCESFDSKLRDEFLNGELFYSIKELRVLVHHFREFPRIGWRKSAVSLVTRTSTPAKFNASRRSGSGP